MHHRTMDGRVPLQINGFSHSNGRGEHPPFYHFASGRLYASNRFATLHRGMKNALTRTGVPAMLSAVRSSAVLVIANSTMK